MAKVKTSQSTSVKKVSVLMNGDVHKALKIIQAERELISISAAIAYVLKNQK